MRDALELKAGDARAALAFAAAVAECADEVELGTRIEALPKLLGAEGVIVTAGRNWMAGATVEFGDPVLYTPALLGAVERDWRDHPVMVPDLTAAAGGARRLSDFVTPRKWRRSALFNDFYRPLGLANEISAQLAWGPAGSSCCVALHRSGPDFGGRELALLELLAPHLRAARARIAAEWRSARLDAFLGEGLSATDLASRLAITTREAEVLVHLAAGRTNAAIAEGLGISRHTVVRHVEHVYAKLDVRTRAAATRIALTALLDGPRARDDRRADRRDGEEPA